MLQFFFKNPIKISIREPSRVPKGGRRGQTRAPGALLAFPRVGSRQGAPRLLVPPLAAPLRLYFPFIPKPRGQNPFSRSCLCFDVAALPRSGALEDLFSA